MRCWRVWLWGRRRAVLRRSVAAGGASGSGFGGSGGGGGGDGTSVRKSSTRMDVMDRARTDYWQKKSINVGTHIQMKWT
ncbi:hypothetical protein DFJ73DRAFT_864645 [Zopfochytrium polystomum]|nr:hypothetical protein DFJ73DRAFT_864645 [Zopfochytrium polystomum]